MEQKEVIGPVDVSLLEAELTPATFLRKANRGGNELYVVDARTAPNVMREVGRLREVAFRAAGGGTGLDCDIDEFDLMDPPCRQLVVWDPEEKKILGGYRFIRGRDVRLLPDGSPRIATGHMFRFSRKFLEEYLPSTLELGRSFVRLENQATRQCSAIYTLDNLWDGLGALTVLYPEIKYLFGKVTMYPAYDRESRDMILSFFSRHFPDPEGLVEPIEPLEITTPREKIDAVFSENGSFRADYRNLNHHIRERGFNIPPLVNAYMGLSPTMRVFGTAINREFGDVEETGIFLAVSEILEEKKKRHIDTYVKTIHSHS